MTNPDIRPFLQSLLSALAVVLLLGMLVATPVAGGADLAIRDGGPVRGEANAPVTLIEYSDFTCGYCVKFFRDTWPLLHQQYVATGKVRFLYRDYPRHLGGPGLEAAVAARCAGEQQRYWAMHDFLFGRSGVVSAADLERQARRLQLDLPRFSQCLRDGRQAAAAYDDRAEGASLGFHGTPGFVLILTRDPGRAPAIMIPGAMGFEVFQRHIDRLLKVAAVR